MARSDIDWVLVSMLDSVSKTGKPMGLTVFSGGLAVSGTVVPEEIYFEKVGLPNVAEGMPKQREEAEREESEILDTLERSNLTDQERRDLQSRLENLERQFIVMTDVSIFGVLPGRMNAATWRGRLSQISGWTLGTASPSD